MIKTKAGQPQGKVREKLYTMNISDATYRAFSWLKHCAKAWNTGGEGIHSPYLFEWVRMVMYDTHPYYVWRDIEQRREAMLRAPKVLDYVDYGTGGSSGVHSRRLVSGIAKTGLEPRAYGKLLFRLVNWLGHQVREEGREGLRIVELGTSLGITTAYLAGADSRDRVMTFEGCPAVAEMARLNWDKLGLKNIDCVQGNIDDTLQAHLAGQVDVAFVDANHTREATLRYFDILAQHVGRKSVVVMDDIHYSREMGKAWEEICNRKNVACTMDLYKMGLVFFDPDYLHKHYKLRL